MSRETATLQLPPPGTIIPSLDGVRGFSLFVVLLFHYEQRRFIPTSLVGDLFARWIHVSWFGLEMFFVLSGFLITGILLDSRDGKHYFRNFYVRRAVRILPLYYGTLAVLFFIVPFLPGLDRATWWVPASTQVWYWTHTTNFLFTIKGWGAAAPLTPHLWSLAVEEQYYIIWPTVVYLCARSRLLTVSAACVVGSLVVRALLLKNGMDPSKVEVFTFARLDGLAFGSFLAVFAREPNGLARLVRMTKPVSVACVAMLAVLFWKRGTDMQEFAVQTVGFTIMTVLLGAIIIMVLVAPEGSLLERAMTAKWLRWVGLHSYAMYIFHYPVMGMLDRSGLGTRELAARFGSDSLGNLTYVALNITLTLCCSLVSWHLVEQPALKLKKLFPYREAKPQSVAAPEGAGISTQPGSTIEVA